jgi:hypothetical protein
VPLAVPAFVLALDGMPSAHKRFTEVALNFLFAGMTGLLIVLSS